MSNTVNPITPIDVTAAAMKRQPKAQEFDNGKFKDMLSSSAGGNVQAKDPLQLPQTEEPSARPQEAPAKLESADKTTAQTKPQEQDHIEEEEDVEYGKKAAAAAMQMYVMAPFAAEAAQTEMTAETEVAAADTADLQITPMATAEAEVQTNSAPSSESALQTAQSTFDQAVNVMNKTEPDADTAIEANTQPTQRRESEETARQNAQPSERTYEASAQEQVRTVQRPQATERRENTERPDREKLPDEITGDIKDTQVIRQPEQSVHRHSAHRAERHDTAGTKFGEMIAKASQELNPNAASTETAPKTETTEEPSTAEQPFILEAKPQETAKQNPKPETELIPRKTPQQPKITANAVVQKDAKAPVTEQRPQKEASKADEALLGMAQQNPTTFTKEVTRSEPAAQQPGQVQVPDQAEQIKAQVIKNLEDQKTEFQMQLQPEELGKVSIKMILEAGKLSVEIAAANPKSAELLSKQAESLIASLKTGNLDVTSVSVVTANENVSAQMNSEYNLSNFRNQANEQSSQNQNGRSNGTGTAQEQTAGEEQNMRENTQSPQRILNYSV